jgi:hypothetical protein
MLINIHMSKFSDQTIRSENSYDLHIIALYEK